MKESDVQFRILKLLKSRGCSVFKTMTCNRNGIADIIACSPTGQFIAIEVKAPGKLHTVSRLQAAYLEEVRSRGGIAILTDNLYDVDKALLSAQT